MSDSIPNAAVDVASSNPRDFSKKKRATRTAKLKQCKLDVRREQWLSQVKKMGEGCKEDGSGKKSQRPVEKMVVKVKTSSEDVIYMTGSTMHHRHYSDSESFPSNSPTSSGIGSNDSKVNFTTSSRTSSSSGRSSSSNIHGFCSGHMSDDEVEDEDGGDNDNNAGDDDCLDDWEAVADALEEKDKKHQDCSPKAPKIDASNVNSESGVKDGGNGNGNGNMVNSCAWKPDDAYRPQNLPNLSKQYTFPLNSERQMGRASIWNIGSVPTSCPICIEDLDGTDSSFLPCSCGFRLCLFCHKRIMEEDGRCPNCRKMYECEPVEGETMLDGGSLTFRLTRSCSMVTRS